MFQGIDERMPGVLWRSWSRSQNGSGFASLCSQDALPALGGWRKGSTDSFEFGDAHTAKKLYQRGPAHPELLRRFIECVYWLGVELEKTQHLDNVRGIGNEMGGALGRTPISSSDQHLRVR